MDAEYLTYLASRSNPPYLSNSRLRRYAQSPFLFFKNYIKGDWPDFADTESMIIGKAFHEALAWYYNQVEDITTDFRDAAMAKRIADYVEEYPEEDMDARIERERLKHRALTVFYINKEHLPSYEEVYYTEQEDYVDYDHVDGQPSVLPLLGVIDLAGKKDGKEVVVDHKTVMSHSESIEDHPEYLIQGVLMFVIHMSYTGRAPEEFHINEFKKSDSQTYVQYLKDYRGNKEGEIKPYKGKQLDKLQEDGVLKVYEKKPQLKTLTMNYDEYSWVFDVVDYMIKAMTVNIAEGLRYMLPNFADRMTGKEEWDYFVNIFFDEIQNTDQETELNAKYAQLYEDYQTFREEIEANIG